MITICCTYFPSLTLQNLEAALYSVRQQDFSLVDQVIVVNNNTSTPIQEIEEVVDKLQFFVPIDVLHELHGDPERTHSWSTNRAVREAETPWIFFTRADYILDPTALTKFALAASQRSFVTSCFYHLNSDIVECECAGWRANVKSLRMLSGREEVYSKIDSGVWLTRKVLFDLVGGLDERLTAWGHAQTHFQYKLFRAGVEFIEIPEVLFYHPYHGAARSLDVAHTELKAIGGNIKEMWARHEGPSPY